MSLLNKKKSEVREWFGIPYAKAERFGKPTLVPFDERIQYDKTGPASLQLGDSSWLNSDRGTSEDCLNLNIWAPKNSDSPLPVVVYIHGGGWEYGSNSQDTSSLFGLASSNQVIGVSLNYRLGALGWLSLSQYGGRLKDATNLGLQDIIAALKWIQQNIAYFGGDPNQVTVTGHSAGAYNLMALLAAPSATGLFHRLAAFSGFPSRIVPAWWAEELAHNLLSELGLEQNPEELLSVDGQLLTNTLSKLLPKDSGQRHGIDNTTIAVVDDHRQPGAVLEGIPMDMIAKGVHKDIDLLISSTTYEAGWYVLNTREAFNPKSNEAIVDELVNGSRIPRSQSERIIAAYKDGKEPAEVRGEVHTDYNFTLPKVRAALSHANAGGRAYMLSVGPTEGSPAVHGTEMYGIVGGQLPNASQEQLERDQFVTDTILSFATGQYNQLWQPVDSRPIVKDIGQRPYESSQHIQHVFKLFDGVTRT